MFSIHFLREMALVRCVCDLYIEAWQFAVQLLSIGSDTSHASLLSVHLLACLMASRTPLLRVPLC